MFASHSNLNIEPLPSTDGFGDGESKKVIN